MPKIFSNSNPLRGCSFSGGSPVLPATRPIANAGGLRHSLEQPRRGRDLSRLTVHKPGESPLQYAMGTLAGLIAPPGHGTDGERRVNEASLKDHVRAILGMQHEASLIDPALAPYLDELSKNESTMWARPVTRSSFTLLCILYAADQEPGLQGCDPLTRGGLIRWLKCQLDPGEVRDDWIPDQYFDTVQFRAQSIQRHQVLYGRDMADWVEVRAMRPFNLKSFDWRDSRKWSHAENALDLCELYRQRLLVGSTGSSDDFFNLQFLEELGVDLGGMKLWNVDLYSCPVSLLTTLRGADLCDANLVSANLKNLDLGDIKLTGALIQRVDLEGARLRVNAEDAVNIILNASSTTGTKLTIDREASEHDISYYVKRQMEEWLDDYRCDLLFNHRNNEQSVLTRIAGLHDSCGDTKRELMRAVVGLLNDKRGTNPDAIVALIPSLGDVLFQDPEYLEGYEDFAGWLCAGLLGDGAILLDQQLGDTALQALGDHATRLLVKEGRGAVTRYSVAIYQVLYAMRRRAASGSSLEVRGEWTRQSEALHKQYCTTLGIALPSLMCEHGVYASERDITADDEVFPLVATDGQTCVMMTDGQYRQLVLDDRSRVPGDENCAWDDLRCVRAGADGMFPKSVGGQDEGGTRGTQSTDSVLTGFPLLRSARQRENATAAQGRMLALAGLKGMLLERFTAALQRRDTREKMIEVADQFALEQTFATRFADHDGRGTHLAQAHFTELRTQWRHDTQKVFAFRLLCMAALYTNYASSHVFGTEHESPNTLRYYAEALLRKARELDPSLFPDDNEFRDWINRLRGEGAAFTCTSVLYGMESRHMDTILSNEAGSGPLHQVRNEMIPLAWRTR
jgi:hypothetical protein